MSRRRLHTISIKVTLQDGEVLSGLQSCIEEARQWMLLLIALPLPVSFDLQPGLILAAHLDDVGAACAREPLLEHEAGLVGPCNLPATCWRTAAAMPEGMAGGVAKATKAKAAG